MDNNKCGGELKFSHIDIVKQLLIYICNSCEYHRERKSELGYLRNKYRVCSETVHAG